MHIEAIVVGAYEVNAYVLWKGRSPALVLDPGADAGLIADCLDRNGKSVAAYLITHGHADHISALAELHGRFPAPVLIHPRDAEWAFSPANQILPHYPSPSPFSGEIRPVGDGDVHTEAGLRFEVMATPGHSPGGVCFFFRDERAVLSGDTLFAGSVGRTDLPGGDSRALARSIRTLAGLPDETAVYPGHGPATTIGHEKKTNFFMRGG